MLRMLTAAFLMAALAGCAALPEGAERGRCRDFVTVNAESGTLKARPPEAKVCRGTTVTVRIRPNKPGSTATKDGTAWVVGQTGNGDIALMVPMSEDVGAVRGYSVNVPGVGMLDPTFRIIR